MLVLRPRFVASVLLSLATGCPTASREETRATISGRVVLQPLAGADAPARVRVDLGRGEGGTAPDGEGYFSFSDIEPDVYELQITYEGGLDGTATGSAYRAQVQRVVARAGGSVALGDIALVLASGTVTGGVVVAGGAGSADGAEVVVRDDAGAAFTGLVQGGAFSVPSVPVGRYRVQVRAEGLAMEPAAVPGCGVSVTVNHGGGAFATDQTPTVRPSRAAVDHAVGEVRSERDETTWYLAGSEVSVFVTAPFAVAGRTWRDDEVPPAWSPFQSAGYLVQGIPADTPVQQHLQFRDACGTASEVITLQLILDGTAPPAPAVILAGGGDPARLTTTAPVVAMEVQGENAVELDGMQVITCAPGAACPDVPGPTWGPFLANRALSLAAVDGRHEVRAWVRDFAGNASAMGRATVLLDRVAPGAVVLEPRHDPSALALRAESVVAWVTVPPADAPLAPGPSWTGIAHLEVDDGTGFAPLCPGCVEDDAWRPCSVACACSDDRLVCMDVTDTAYSREFAGVRARLAGGATNRVAVRAVDLAGNVGDGASLLVRTQGLAPVVTRAGAQWAPSVFGGHLVYTDLQGRAGAARLAGDGTPRAFAECPPFEVPVRTDSRAGPGVEVAAAVGPRGMLTVARRLIAGGFVRDLELRSPGPDDLYCTADDAVTADYAQGVPGFSSARIVTLATTQEWDAWILERDGVLGPVRQLWVRRFTDYAQLTLGAAPPTTGSATPPPLADLAVSGDRILVADHGFTRGDALPEACPAPLDWDRLRMWRVFQVTGNFAEFVETASFCAETAALGGGGDNLLAVRAHSDGGPPLDVSVDVALLHPAPDGGWAVADHLALMETTAFAAAVDARRATLVLAGIGNGGEVRTELRDRRIDAAGRFAPAERIYPMGQTSVLAVALEGDVVRYVGGQPDTLDILSVPLAQLRWEHVDATGVAALYADGRGNVLAVPRQVPGTAGPRDVHVLRADGTVARRRLPVYQRSRGGDRAGGAGGAGRFFVTAGRTQLLQLSPGPGGWFTAGDPAPVRVDFPETTAGDEITEIATAGDHLVATLCSDEQTCSVRWVDLAAHPPAFAVISGSAPAAVEAGTLATSETLTVWRQQRAGESFFTLHAFATPVGPVTQVAEPVRCPFGPTAAPGCVNTADGAMSAAMLGVAVDGASVYELVTVSDRVTLMGVDKQAGVVDPGWLANGAWRFRTLTLPPDLTQVRWLTVVGGRVLFMASPPAGGPQVFEAHLREGRITQLTSHYSEKVFLVAADDTRTFWLDNLFSTTSVFGVSP